MLSPKYYYYNATFEFKIGNHNNIQQMKYVNVWQY